MTKIKTRLTSKIQVFISEVLKGVIFNNLVISNLLVIDYPLILVVSYDRLKKVTMGSTISPPYFMNDFEEVRCLNCHFKNNRLVTSNENS